jgi:hypothetical protein
MFGCVVCVCVCGGKAATRCGLLPRLLSTGSRVVRSPIVDRDRAYRLSRPWLERRVAGVIRFAFRREVWSADGTRRLRVVCFDLIDQRTTSKLVEEVPSLQVQRGCHVDVVDDLSLFGFPRASTPIIIVVPRASACCCCTYHGAWPHRQGLITRAFVNGIEFENSICTGCR